MPVNLSIKDVPDDLAERLRTRAKQHHRSLQGELMALIEQAAPPPRHFDAVAFLERQKALGPVGDTGNSTEMVRAMRDSRYGDPDR